MRMLCAFSPSRRGERGFTLIEVTIAMVVLGLFLTAYLQAYNVYIQQKQIDDTKGNLRVIQSALQKYALRNGRYPSPADLSLGPGDSDFGQEEGSFPVCAPATADHCRTNGARDTAADGDAIVDQVRIGGVPFAVLGVPQRFIVDGYGRKITYAVSRYLTDKATFRDDWGVVDIVKNDGTNASDMNDNAHYALVSHGPDGAGAFVISGLRPVACVGAAKDGENCDNDGVFTNNGVMSAGKETRYQVDVALNHYDDHIVFTNTTIQDLWTLTANTPDIYVRRAGNVRVGPADPNAAALTPCTDFWNTTVDGTGTITAVAASNANCPDIPDTKVDVIGDVAADHVRINRLCPFGGCDAIGALPGTVPAWAIGSNYAPKYFSPGIISGVPNAPTDPAAFAGATLFYGNGGGIDCGDRGLFGIEFADERCSNAFPNAGHLGGVTCGVGTGGRGIVLNGAGVPVLQCSTP